MNLRDNGSRPVHDGAESIPDAVKSGKDGMVDKSIWPIPMGMEEAARQAREATERLTRNFGFSGAEGDRLALKSRQNIDAMKRCGTVLSQSFQKSSRGWVDVIHNQWTRNFDGMSRLMRAKSVHEFGAIQGDLARENLEHVLKDSRIMAEGSMQAADEAGRSLAALAMRGADDKA